MKTLFSRIFFIFYFSFFVILSSCSVSQKISSNTDKILLQDSVISTGHIGISIYEPATNSYWYNYNADKYFIPASNTKLFTLYAGMKYLGDSLVGLQYELSKDTIFFRSTGDPTFLHPDFSSQPAFDLLNSTKYLVYDIRKRPKLWGKGWSWDDFAESYMVDRSSFPIYGNQIRARLKSFNDDFLGSIDGLVASSSIIPKYFKRADFFKWINYDNLIEFDSVELNKIATRDTIFYKGYRTEMLDNTFDVKLSLTDPGEQRIPFSTQSIKLIFSLLKDTLNKDVWMWQQIEKSDGPRRHFTFKKLHSQPSDSLFKPMMHNSDNFFAEQILLMVSNEKLGYMNDEAIINTLLKNDLEDIPLKPRWVDGSGLSRYNLFTPKSFIYILNKMKNEFGIERLKRILPTGGEGTLENYFTTDSLFIYAKTGSMSNQSCLSGFLITKNNKLLIFSVLANNFQGKATTVRRSVEHFLQEVRNKN